MREIPLTHGLVALVDDEDYEWLSQFKWYAVRTDYISQRYYGMAYIPVRLRKTNKKITYMHRVVLNPPKDKQIDHINGNGLDNRKENLRIVTNRENQQNLRDSPIRKYTSKYPGVSKQKSGKFRSQISINGRNKELGMFTNEIDAAMAYQREYELLKLEGKV
jgi:hypothetical protein